jgi:hypothetical protein
MRRFFDRTALDFPKKGELPPGRAAVVGAAQIGIELPEIECGIERAVVGSASGSEGTSPLSCAVKCTSVMTAKLRR